MDVRIFPQLRTRLFFWCSFIHLIRKLYFKTIKARNIVVLKTNMDEKFEGQGKKRAVIYKTRSYSHLD